MVWDYAEGNPLLSRGSSWANYLEYIAVSLESIPSDCNHARVRTSDARTIEANVSMVITDPPYYDAINYAALADYFYVWLKRSIGNLYPALLVVRHA
jgi:putative DNA methylase